jgi:hypothetical protein
MKRVVFLLSLYLLLGSTLIFSQENPQSPYSWTADYKTGRATGLFTSKTYDEVWLAAKKYVQLKANLLSSDKESGILTTNLNNSKWVIETKPEGISILIVSAFLQTKSKKMTRTEYHNMFLGVAALLYGLDIVPQWDKKK